MKKATKISSHLYIKKLADLNLRDPFFDSLKSDYEGFESWVERNPTRECYVQERIEAGGIEGLLVLKEESAPFSDIKPIPQWESALKVCTFKIDGHNTRLGQLFVQLILKKQVMSNLRYSYLTILPTHPELVRLVNRYGFHQCGTLSKTGENVYAKDIENIHGHPILDYPRFQIEGKRFFALGIYPEYHTKMFSISKLNNESPDIIDDLPYTNSITKVYVCKMPGIQNLKSGDIIFIRRTKGYAPAYYTACVTSICTVLEIRKATSFASFEEYYNYTSPYNLFTEEELQKYYDNNSYAIKMVYNAALNKRPTNGQVIEILGGSPDYWGLFELNETQAKQLMTLGGIHERLIIN